MLASTSRTFSYRPLKKCIKELKRYLRSVLPEIEPRSGGSCCIVSAHRKLVARYLRGEDNPGRHKGDWQCP